MRFWKIAVLCILAVEVVGNASGLVTFASIKGWYAMLERPPGTPPNGTFGPVWGLLFGLMGFALALVISRGSGQDRKIALRWFLIQFLLNIAWTPAFFGWHRMDVALVIICMLIFAVALTVRHFGKIDRLAGWLLVPYLLWVAYACYLNAGFLLLNT